MARAFLIASVHLIDDEGQRLIAWNAENLSVALNAKNLDELIVGLTDLREQFAPPVSTAEPAANEPAEAKLDPQWWIGPRDIRQRRDDKDPKPGWLVFAVPMENLRKLHAGLGKLGTWSEERAAGQSTN